MIEVKRKRGRPAKEKSLVEKLRLDPKKFAVDAKSHAEDVKFKSFEMSVAALTRRIAKLEGVLEDAVNAGRELHKKIETLSSVRHTGWQAHTVGESPVFAETVVEVLLRSGEKNGPYAAGNFLWRECGSGTIVAYKVV